ncbi:uncharacterized protein FOMMEDRAFT_141227 [Fomitiporia mediterranea MF3/22]|uniref:uncharacterized protein n=1 Tax=Fomitiporia mediterranea (strain MF3/22) TaxID=694068 RepID=UPI0004409156|nr:uncharacterized protein FOMMEDRAFT_141227 [Fomitiporia mediterranea MF3/22]EJD02044.1 hypothetical protein FOMMEDRAFT_141227 [Fomitiporia mediterranea MF3/22]
MGEAGGTQLVVVFLALVLIVSWRGGKPPSTLTMVAPALLPVIYANTVLLHTASTYLRPTLEMSSPRTPSKTVRSKFEDIEMGLRGSSNRSPAHVDLAGAAAAAESAYSTTVDSTDGGATLRAKAMAYGREKEAAAASGSAAPAHVHLERDTIGESSTSNLLNNAAGGTASASANASETAKMRAPSVRSGVSTALSLELPTFRRGRARWTSGYPVDVESGSEGSDEWDEEIEFDSEEDGGGTWDYGFANTEREKERAAAATMLAGANSLSPNDTGTRIGVQCGGRNPWQNFTRQPGKRNSYPAGGSSRPSSWRRTVHPLATSTNAGDGDAEADENDDTLSMLSSTSAGRRRRYSHHRPPKRPQGPSFSKPKPLHRLLPRAPLPPPLPSTSSANASTDSVYLTGGGGGGLGSPAGSVLVIGRGNLMREPSIAEQSINAAASVAATRASTGSMWSTFSYTYPRPFTLPDLDVDLQGGLGISTEGSGDGVVGGSTGVNGRGSGEGTRTGESDLGAALALSSLSGSGSGVGDSNAPHPYSAAAAGVGGSSAGVDTQEGTARRRWNVHPLKRIADMGRLRS